MAEKCSIGDCRVPASFECSCDNSVKICQDHISTHIQNRSDHRIRSIPSTTQQRTNQAIFALSNLNSRAFAEGKDMFCELCEKMCGIVEELSKRQQSLIELSNENFTSSVEEKIVELEKVNLKFRPKQEFKVLLDKHLSQENYDFGLSNLEEFRSDFRTIAESLDKSNQVLVNFTEDYREEMENRKKLEIRIQELEEGFGDVKKTKQAVSKIEAVVEKYENQVIEFKNNLDIGKAKIDKVEEITLSNWIS